MNSKLEKGNPIDSENSETIESKINGSTRNEMADNWVSINTNIEHLNWMATIHKLKDNLYQIHTIRTSDQGLYKAVANRILLIANLNNECEFSLKGYSKQALAYIDESTYSIQEFYGTVNSNGKEKQRLTDTIISFAKGKNNGL